MRKELLLLGAFGMLTTATLCAQEFHLQPTPQEYITQKDSVDIPRQYQILSDNSVQDGPALPLLRSLMPEEVLGASFRVYIGVKGDKIIKKYQHRIPRKSEGYFLKIEKDCIVIAGADERGAYYGVQTLAQLLALDKLPLAEVTDYPDVPYRGVVEGFYGAPWSQEARIRQLDFYGRNKMNVYIYGPKDDPYHRTPNWRKPYPAREGEELKVLVNRAKENNVIFYWAIHPGQDIRWNEEDRSLLLQKFESMYQLGVRGFAVFFDDISGEGTKADKQAELLNYIDDHFVKVKRDVAPLILCPTEYNKSWTDVEGGYLTTLGDKLNEGIKVMWTGDMVVATIDKSTLDFVNPLLKRKAYIWWNFPVSDYVQDHLLLGPVYGNGLDIKDDMSAFVSNPMEHAEASKIAIYSVASYAWNPTKYNSEKTWKDAIMNILPDAATELEFFAAHNSDLGPNGHKYRREESVNLQPTAQSFTESYIKNKTYTEKDFSILQETFSQMVESSDILVAHADKNPIIVEIMPWLYQFKLLGETGNEVLAMVKAYDKNDQSLFMRKYKHVKALQQQMFQIDQTYNQNPYQPGIKTAGRVIKPLIDQTFATVTQCYNQKYSTLLNAETDYMPHKLISDISQIKNLPLQVKINRIQISPALEVIRWPGNGSLTIELDQVYPGENIEIDFGKPEIETWGSLEISANGKDWSKVHFTQENNRLTASLQQKPIKAVRFTNMQHQEQEIYLRRFIITIDK